MPSMSHEEIKNFYVDRVSKGDLGYLYKKHEERETPEQEAQESPKEQKLEKELGVEKTAFWAGFEKQAQATDEGMARAIGGLASLIGGGALVGHSVHVSKKMDSARHGKKYEAKSFIERHPKLTGALTGGAAPLLSGAVSKYKNDKDNEGVKQVTKEHPLVGRLERLGHYTASL
jgi:hypothetical protein